jgi:heme oxygenase
MAALMAPTVTWDDYRGYLARMTQVYGSLEPGLFATLDEALVGHPCLKPALRPKLPALRADLRALGVPEPPLPPPLRPTGLSEAVGGLYVLEGATLGSRVIARHLRRHLKREGADPLDSSAFLGSGQDSQAPSLSAAWRQLGAALENLREEGRISRDGVVEGARSVFGRVHQILAGQAGPTGER